ncbi:MAG: hypothetical protein PCFJNLEI_02579 [Verrucomicrobiae bacterium]|nr:hypothetical protein [Verrucomicrobiae bacterium]
MTERLWRERTPAAIPEAGVWDVVVCGGGPAGIAAAIAAGRTGARTLLIEQLTNVGGMNPGAHTNLCCDSPGGPIFIELEMRLAQIGHAHRTFRPERDLDKAGRVHLHGEMLKAVAMEMLLEAKVELRFGTFVSAAELAGNRVIGVIATGKGGARLFRAGVVVDCTADADVAASAGAPFFKGDPQDGRVQHVNYKPVLGGQKTEVFELQKPEPAVLREMARQAVAAGLLHPPTGIFKPMAECFPFDDRTGKMNFDYWEIANVDPTDAAAVSRTLAECQRAALEMIRFARQNLPGFEKAYIARFPALLGTRESRRIAGQYVLTRDDVLTGRKFADGIARACFFMDFHDSPPGSTTPYSIDFKRANRPPPGDYYEIPYRALVPREIEALLVAGRCISSDRSAHASLRVQPTCFFTGEAAGLGAAMAVKSGQLPGALDAGPIRAATLSLQGNQR